MSIHCYVCMIEELINYNVTKERCTMANKNLIDECKEYLPLFYDNGEWKENPKLRYNGRDLEPEISEFIGELLHFLVDSKFLNNCARIWLFSNLRSVNAAIEAYNRQCDEEDKIVIKTAQTKVNYCKSKLNNIFGYNPLFNVMAYPDKYLDKFWEGLDGLKREYADVKEYNHSLLLKLPKSYIKKELDEVSFVRLTNMLNTYSLKTVKDIERGMSSSFNTDMIGYYNYLISSSKLSDTDNERLKIIKDILGIGQEDNK